MPARGVARPCSSPSLRQAGGRSATTRLGSARVYAAFVVLVAARFAAAERDCRVEWRGTTTICRDGDSSCDTDAATDGACTFAASLCVHCAPGTIDHLRASVPWGAEATITPRSKGQPYRVSTGGPAYAAMTRAMRETWGREPALMGSGGSIPFVFDFARLFPDAAILLTGAGDPTSNPHSEDESVSLDDLEKSCVAEALFFGYLAE